MKVSHKNIPVLCILNAVVAFAVILLFTVLHAYTLGSDYGVCRVLSRILILVLLAFAAVMDYSLLFAKAERITNVDSAKKCKDALEDYIGKAGKKKIRPWKGQLQKALQILENLQKNEITLEKLSYAKYGDETELDEYQNVVQELEDSVVDAMQHILTRLCIMDEEQFKQANMTGDMATIQQYQAHEQYINRQIAFADHLVHSFAELITELSMVGNEENQDTKETLQDMITAIRSLNHNEDDVERLAKKYKSM